MAFVQYFATTLFDDETGVTAEVISIPYERRDLDETEVFERLDVEPMQRLESDDLWSAVSLALGGEPSSNVGIQSGVLVRIWGGEFEQQAKVPWPSWLDMVETVSFAPVVPVEESPLSKRALATLLGTGSAWLVLVGNRPVLIVIAAGSIVLLKAAWGIGEGLEEGFREVSLRLAKQLGRKKSRETEDDSG